MEVLDDLLLTRKVGQLLWSDTILKLQIALYISHIAIYAHSIFSFSATNIAIFGQTLTHTAQKNGEPR
jgi:hypothetical protein